MLRRIITKIREIRGKAMAPVDTIIKNKKPAVDEAVKKWDWERLAGIDEREKAIFQSDIGQLRIGEKAPPARIPKIKELELLKDGVYSVDLEKTINDMYMVIHNMESQLESVLKINVVLEKDLRDAKTVIADLCQSKSEIEDRIARMQEEIPSKRELQIEIDHLIEERNATQTAIRELTMKIDTMKKTSVQSQQRSSNLEDQKRDFITEINFLESRLHTAMEKISAAENKINLLNGEKIVQEERISTLQKDLNDTLDEKFGLIKELKASRAAMAELHSALNISKHQAKKSFYKGQSEPDQISEEKLTGKTV
jgi:chromosome segregation ATPase